MFWSLFLAHLIADYPLQNDAMVRAKRRRRGLTVHVLLHLLVTLLLVWPATWQLWLPLLALAVLHFAIDSFKNFLAEHRPQWIRGPYLFDQVLHVLSIALIAGWIELAVPQTTLWLSPTWTIVLSGYLLTTYVWAISERVLVYRNPAYMAEVQETFWPRIFLRGGALTVVLLLVGWGSDLAPDGTQGLAGVLRWPYGDGPRGRRALFTDLVAVVGGVLFIWGSAMLAALPIPF